MEKLTKESLEKDLETKAVIRVRSGYYTDYSSVSLKHFQAEKRPFEEVTRLDLAQKSHNKHRPEHLLVEDVINQILYKKAYRVDSFRSGGDQATIVLVPQ